MSTRSVSTYWKGGSNFEQIKSLEQHIDLVLTRYPWCESSASDRQDLNYIDMTQDFNHWSTFFLLCAKPITSWHETLFKIILNVFSDAYAVSIFWYFAAWLPSYWSQINISSITLKTPHWSYSQLFIFQPTHKWSSVMWLIIHKTLSISKQKQHV